MHAVSRTSLFGSAALAALLVGCAPVPPPQTATTVQPPADLQPTWQAYADAWSGQDTEVFGRFFTPDTHATVQGDVIHGRDAIVADWIRPTLPVVQDMVITPEAFDVQGNRVMERGRYQFTAHPPGEQPQPQSGTYQQTWERGADGQWRVVRFTVT